MNSIGQLRWVARLEGVSYLALLLVAVPLKHVFGLPMAVRVVGGIHGFLFLGFGLGLYQARIEQHWSAGLVLKLLAVSLVPGGVFWLDRQLQQHTQLSPEPRSD